MFKYFKTGILPLPCIQVSRSRLRRHNTTALHKAKRAIVKDGLQRPLIIDRYCRLLSDTSTYLALKALDCHLVKVLTLTIPSPASVRALQRLLDRWEAVRRDASYLDAELALIAKLEISAKNSILDLLPVEIYETENISMRLLPGWASDDGANTPSDV